MTIIAIVLFFIHSFVLNWFDYMIVYLKPQVDIF